MADKDFLSYLENNSSLIANDRRFKIPIRATTELRDNIKGYTTSGNTPIYLNNVPQTYRGNGENETEQVIRHELIHKINDNNIQFGKEKPSNIKKPDWMTKKEYRENINLYDSLLKYLGDEEIKSYALSNNNVKGLPGYPLNSRVANDLRQLLGMSTSLNEKEKNFIQSGSSPRKNLNLFESFLDFLKY